jgi:hypothetical protein
VDKGPGNGPEIYTLVLVKSGIFRSDKGLWQEIRHIVQGNDNAIFIKNLGGNIVICIQYAGGKLGPVTLERFEIRNIEQNKKVEGRTDEETQQQGDAEQKKDAMDMRPGALDCGFSFFKC